MKMYKAMDNWERGSLPLPLLLLLWNFKSDSMIMKGRIRLVKREFYIVDNKNLAIAVSYMLGEDFFTFDDKREGREGKKCYSFKNTDRFREILTLIFDTRNRR